MMKATSVGCEKANDDFSIKGFSNWKNALANFATHYASDRQKTAMDLGETF